MLQGFFFSVSLRLHPNLTILHKILHYIQSFLCIGDSRNLEFHITELDGVEVVVLSGDKDSAAVDRRAVPTKRILDRERGGTD